MFLFFNSAKLAIAKAAGILAIDLNSAYGELLGYSESRVTVAEEEIYCTHDRIQAELVVKDLDGNAITRTAAGSEVSLEATLSLDCNTSDDPVTMLFEVRDSDRITKYLTYQQVPAYSAEQIATSSSWIAGEPGEYPVRFFYITDLNSSGILYTVEQYEITVY